MISANCWIPKQEPYEGYETWKDYEDLLYSIFKCDFIEDHPEFEGKRVAIRKEPIEYGKEEAFFHVTCQDYLKDGERVPDLRRCERIRWVRAFIENYGCDPSLCPECDGVKVWSEPYKSTSRVHMLLEEERYMVVIERRGSYCLLITAFYFDQDHKLKKKLKHYDIYSEK